MLTAILRSLKRIGAKKDFQSRPLTENTSTFNDFVRSLGDGLVAGQRESLAKAITLIESTRNDHQQAAMQLFDYISLSGPNKIRVNSLFRSGHTLRLGIAGPPGAGKSTFIEAFGLRLIDEGLRVAVIPVDPSSHISGGSILGDKTRMDKLSRSDDAYIRGSPTRGVLGGIAEHTADSINLCEAAKFDVTVIESVGLGQSEVDIDMAVDMLLVILPPASGDSLQASKKGIMEAADMIAINKADGDLLSAAKHTKADYGGAMQFIRQKHIAWKVPVELMSSRTGFGLENVMKHVVDYHDLMSSNGSLLKKRTLQASHWMMNQFKKMIIHEVMNCDEVRNRSTILMERINRNEITARQAAAQLFESYHSSRTASRSSSSALRR